MSTTLLIPCVGALCVAAAALLLPSGPRRRGAPPCPRVPSCEAEERLVTVNEIDAVRATFDAMLLCKGLLSPGQLDTIRRGTKSRGVVTAMRATGGAREHYREVELDLMVRRRDGRQFPARQTALIPAASMDRVTPGSEIVAYYRFLADQMSVAVCVPPW